MTGPTWTKSPLKSSALERHPASCLPKRDGRIGHDCGWLRFRDRQFISLAFRSRASNPKRNPIQRDKACLSKKAQVTGGCGYSNSRPPMATVNSRTRSSCLVYVVPRRNAKWSGERRLHFFFFGNQWRNKIVGGVAWADFVASNLTSKDRPRERFCLALFPCSSVVAMAIAYGVENRGGQSFARNILHRS